MAGLSVPMDAELCFSKKILMIFLLYGEPPNMESGIGKLVGLAKQKRRSTLLQKRLFI
jgi:hypothetical protein